ncbi:hypothetical protein JTE90_029462 [Oedothorax gibbosus]|uniref:Uncharacterized protein n=1 Tax=Oedothorax gibbosus TaxID=931172 RepID=A0AAV6V510_9ARAC|nr:hypothetical protein JTE90_029462 [Oedothorax gibbosus]
MQVGEKRFRFQEHQWFVIALNALFSKLCCSPQFHDFSTRKGLETLQLASVQKVPHFLKESPNHQTVIKSFQSVLRRYRIPLSFKP